MNVDDLASTLRQSGARPRAGGTDLLALAQLGRATGPYLDLCGVPELHGVRWRPDGSARIGATTTVAELAADPALAAAYPALTATAAALATPQVRAAATLGGNLLQRNRCWYFRNPRFSCHQSGGDGCPARTGAHLYSVVIDQGPCAAPHPSSLAVALLAYGAVAVVHGRGDGGPAAAPGHRSDDQQLAAARAPASVAVSVADLYGDGADPTRDHLLAPHEVLAAVELPPPVAGERGAYHRATARVAAEWPLVEAVARLVLDGDTVATAVVAVGGVARTPLRLPEVEAALAGAPPAPQRLHRAASAATVRCAPLPQTHYKVDLLRDTIVEVLERAVAVEDSRAHVQRPG
jgi:xanthine dehydrogenase YagS FAD-binding subunit